MRLLALVALIAGAAGLTGHATAQGSAPASSVSVSAQPAKAVVELFTSQGCSSCPAADELLAKLGKRDDLIALSLSVDYWDYLGWKDTLASPKFSERQRAYSKSLGDGMVYTPQLVVNGLTHVNGSDQDKIARALEKTSKTVGGLHVPIGMKEVEGKLVVEAGAAPHSGPVKDATLWLAVLSPSVEVKITRGENKGRTITYSNVVRDMIPIGMWNGKPMIVQLERHSFMPPGTESCVVLLQQGRAGPIIGAAQLKQF